MPDNPYLITVKAGENCDITAVAHAGWYQVLKITDANQKYTLEGTGENVPMLTPAKEDTVSLSATDSERTVSLYFQFSETQGGTLKAARVLDPIFHKPTTFKDVTKYRTEIFSEDSVDDDKNDTYATVECISIAK